VWPIACWDCGFESRQGHGCLSLVSVVCLSGRGLCDGPITRPEESYRLWCVLVCDVGTTVMRRPWPALGCCGRGKIIIVIIIIIIIIIIVCQFFHKRHLVISLCNRDAFVLCKVGNES
jgi:hypothetical protein